LFSTLSLLKSLVNGFILSHDDQSFLYDSSLDEVATKLKVLLAAGLDNFHELLFLVASGSEVSSLLTVSRKQIVNFSQLSRVSKRSSSYGSQFLLDVVSQLHAEGFSTGNKSERSSQVLNDMVSSLDDLHLVLVVGEVLKNELSGSNQSNCN
jgi:hypothetical protein